MLYQRAIRPIIVSVICLILISCTVSSNPLESTIPQTITPSDTLASPRTPLGGLAIPTGMNTSNSVSLIFTTLAEGAAPGRKDAMPYLRLVRTDTQRAALATKLSSINYPKLNAVDLPTSVIIAAFQGLQPTSGYKIEIVTVRVSEDFLDVTVKRSSPIPGELVRQGFESPYHLVLVARGDFEKYQLANYQLMDSSGDVLAQGTIESIQ